VYASTLHWPPQYLLTTFPCIIAVKLLQEQHRDLY